MNPPRKAAPRRKAVFLAAARADVKRLHGDDEALAVLALTKIRELERGSIAGVPLAEMAATGDLTDCRKVYFGPGNPPSHRIVYRDLGPAEGIEILEIVAVEAREELYAYLLAAVRLGRLPVESEPNFTRVHQEQITRRTRRR